MISVLAALAYAVLATALGPLVLVRGGWQVWRPRVALLCWYVVLGSSVAATVLAFVEAIGLAAQSARGQGGGSALVLLGVWTCMAAVAAVAALVLHHADDLIRGEGVRREEVEDLLISSGFRAERRADVEVRWLATDAPVAASFRAPGPVVVLSTGLAASLSAAELDSVLAHERAHLRGRHHLALLLAVVHAELLPRFGPAARMEEATRLLVELIADDAAARATGPRVASRALAAMAADSCDATGLRMRSQRMSLIASGAVAGATSRSSG